MSPQPPRWWEFEEPARPIEVEGGLTARSTHGAIGATWWSKRFVAVLESLGAGGRLTRGRAYARKGQVLSLDVGPGVVHGTVQGSRPKPYEAWITMRVLPDEVWERIETAIGSQALYAAQLLGGELPAELEQVVADAGGELFPRSFGDLSMRCTCPDDGLPCKHLAAVFYLLAESFDDDPFRILRWRGRSREQVLAGVAGAARPSPGEASAPSAPRPPGTADVLGELPDATAGDVLDRFWVSPVPLPPVAPTLDAPVDLLLRQLPPAPAALGGSALTDELRAAYRRLGQAAAAPSAGSTDPQG